MQYNVDLGGSPLAIIKTTTSEQAYYRSLYCQFFPNTDSTIPYFWMPNMLWAHSNALGTL